MPRFPDHRPSSRRTSERRSRLDLDKVGGRERRAHRGARLPLWVLATQLALAFSLIAATGIHPALPETGFGRWVMGVLALLNAFVFVGLVVFLRRHSRIAYWLALVLLTTISVLTYADEFGPADLIVLMINILMLLLLVRDRGWYLSPAPSDLQRS